MGFLTTANRYSLQPSVSDPAASEEDPARALRRDIMNAGVRKRQAPRPSGRYESSAGGDPGQPWTPVPGSTAVERWVVGSDGKRYREVRGRNYLDIYSPGWKLQSPEATGRTPAERRQELLRRLEAAVRQDQSAGAASPPSGQSLRETGQRLAPGTTAAPVSGRPVILCSIAQWMHVCYHEAGHAIVAWALGSQLLQVSVRPNGSGECSYVPATTDPAGNVMIAVAGAVAEGASYGELFRSPDGTQARQAMTPAMVAQHGGPGAALKAYARKARAILDQHRAALNALACELDQRGPLAGAAAVRVIEAAAA
jgi:hypothetical protein